MAPFFSSYNQNAIAKTVATPADCGLYTALMRERPLR